MGVSEIMCSTCKEIKPIVEFQKEKNRKNGYRKRCKTCGNKYCAKSRLNSPDHYKSSWIKCMYGLEDWMELVKQQNFKCAICNKELDLAKNTHVDHDHNTNKVRGILCHSCNMALGFFKDDVSNIRQALIYLTINNN